MGTPNIVPRANGEGSVGTASKRWDKGYFDNMDVASGVTAGSIETTGDVSAAGKITAGSIETTGDVSLGGVESLKTNLDDKDSKLSTIEKNLSPLIYASAAAHNSVYRGKYLGASVTEAQWAAIKAGTFDDLYIGDYWTIGGVDYVIAAFDYYLHCGDQETTVHHVTLVPRKNMYTHVMNDTNTTGGGYVGSKMYQSGLNNAKTAIANAFGSAHILTIRQLYTNATNSQYGYGTAMDWYSQSVFLMSEKNVYGCEPFTEFYRGQNWGTDHYSPDNSQYPVFMYDKTMIHTRQDYWLRNVATSGLFAIVYGNGSCNDYYASSAFGVRPAFNIYQS